MEQVRHPWRLVALVLVVLVAFAANSVLCRKALSLGTIDPASFSLLRIASGALMLGLLSRLRGGRAERSGSWRAALALLLYVVGFSYAYMTLAAGSGALLLFGAVQATMIIRGLLTGERLRLPQWLGLGLALAGLVALVAPGVNAPDPFGAGLMLMAGVAWGAYSLLGRSSKQAALHATAGNFLKAVPMALVPAALALLLGRTGWDLEGVAYAAASGALASGLGYALWYEVLPSLKAATAASVQLSVPVITAVGGTLMLGETLSLRLTMASLAVLGGIALVVRTKRG